MAIRSADMSLVDSIMFFLCIMVMVFNVTFNHISVISVLLVNERGIHGVINHRSQFSH